MAFEVTATAASVADAILVWSGVSDPTPAQVAQAELAATSAIDTIKHYRGLGVDDDFEDEYNALAVEMGVYAYQKRGAEGTTAASENGVLVRSYEKGSFPPSMLSRITLPIGSG